MLHSRYEASIFSSAPSANSLYGNGNVGSFHTINILSRAGSRAHPVSLGLGRLRDGKTLDFMYWGRCTRVMNVMDGHEVGFITLISFVVLENLSS